MLGAGGHGSAPHSAKDPVTAAAEMVTALQVMITRQFNMFDPVVLSVGVLQAGTKRNVIPETARIEATIRTFSEPPGEQMMTAVPRAAEGHRRGPRPGGRRRLPQEYPLTITDEDETHTAEKTIAGPLRRDRGCPAGPLRSAAPRTSPGCWPRCPAPSSASAPSPRAPTTPPPPFNHSPYATFDDGVLADGAALYAELAISRIAALASAGNPHLPSAS